MHNWSGRHARMCVDPDHAMCHYARVDTTTNDRGLAMIYRGYTATEIQPGKWKVEREGKTAEYKLGSEEAVMNWIDAEKRKEARVA